MCAPAMAAGCHAHETDILWPGQLGFQPAQVLSGFAKVLRPDDKAGLLVQERERISLVHSASIGL